MMTLEFGFEHLSHALPRLTCSKHGILKQASPEMTYGDVRNLPYCCEPAERLWKMMNQERILVHLRSGVKDLRVEANKEYFEAQ